MPVTGLSETREIPKYIFELVILDASKCSPPGAGRGGAVKFESTKRRTENSVSSLQYVVKDVRIARNPELREASIPWSMQP